MGRLRASITIWALLTWTFVVMPMMALTVELPIMLSARMTMVHAARAAVQAAYQRCTDFEGYQTGQVAQQQSLGCVDTAAQDLFALYLHSQGLGFTQHATLRVTADPLYTHAHQMQACIVYVPKMMPTWSIPNPVCVVEQSHFEFRHG